MSEITDPSLVYIKAAQYFVNQKLEALKDKKFTYKAHADQGISLETFPWAELSSSAGLEQLCPRADTRIAIIGAGVAGLRTAMLLQNLKIPYRIFEANDGPGGRLFTYHFPSDPMTSPPGKHNYYEVGAMRFPKNDANKPTFELFEELGLSFRDENNPNGELIPFIYGLDDNIRHFNNITTTVKEVTKNISFDVFNEAYPSGNVPKDFLDQLDVDRDGNQYRGLDACFFKAFNDLGSKLLENFDEEWPKFLEEWDWASTRSYLAQGGELKFLQTVIDWIEKHKSGTGCYARAVAEEVLESITFDHPRSEKFDWWCIEGGSEVLINKMLSKLTDKPCYDHRVTAIHEEEQTTKPQERMRVSILGRPDEYFSHVVSTVSFSVLRTIKTAGVKMNFNQQEAMRALNYGHSIKVGIKFKTRWWEVPNVTRAPQVGGASRTDRQIRVVVYPSYGLNETGPGVLMVSYNWDQDASRFGSLITLNTEFRSAQFSPNRPHTSTEKLLLEQIYEDLAVLHAPQNTNPHNVEEFKQMLIKETLDFHAYDWYSNPYTMGAFAQFTPGQFSTLYADILQPAGHYGNFHFAGEVASHHHAWIAGALDSATRVATHISMDLDSHHALEVQTDCALPQSLVFKSQESIKDWHRWGLVEEV